MADAEPRKISRRTFLKWLSLGAAGAAAASIIPGEPQPQDVSKEHQREIEKPEPLHVELQTPAPTLTSIMDKLESLKTLDEEHLIPLIKNLMIQLDKNDQPPIGMYSMYVYFNNLQDKDGHTININYYFDSEAKNGQIWRAVNPSNEEEIDSDLAKLGFRPSPYSAVTIGYFTNGEWAPFSNESSFVKQHQLSLVLNSQEPQKVVDNIFLLLPANSLPSALEDAQKRVQKTNFYKGKELKPDGYALALSINDGTNLYTRFTNDDNPIEGNSSPNDIQELQSQFRLFSYISNSQNPQTV